MINEKYSPETLSKIDFYSNPEFNPEIISFSPEIYQAIIDFIENYQHARQVKHEDDELKSLKMTVNKLAIMLHHNIIRQNTDQQEKSILEIQQFTQSQKRKVNLHVHKLLSEMLYPKP